jgi:hypothetical protein
MEFNAPGASTLILHAMIAPVGPVPNDIIVLVELLFVSVCTPSENEKEMGDTVLSGGMFGARGADKVTIPVTKSAVV